MDCIFFLIVIQLLIRIKGYIGKGYDLRPRPSWNLYPSKTKDALVKQSLDLPTWFPRTEDEWGLGSWVTREKCVIRDGTFIIGNHCDELTVSGSLIEYRIITNSAVFSSHGCLFFPSSHLLLCPTSLYRAASTH